MPKLLNEDLNKELIDIRYALDAASIVAICDPNGVLEYVNQKICDLSGYNQDELIGKHYDFIDSGFYPQSFFMNLFDILSKGEIWCGELKEKAKSGQYYWTHSTLVPFLDSEGKPKRFIAIRKDITKRKWTESLSRTLYNIGQLIAETTPQNESSQRFMDTLCQELDWDLGMNWRLYKHQPEQAQSVRAFWKNAAANINPNKLVMQQPQTRDFQCLFTHQQYHWVNLNQPKPLDNLSLSQAFTDRFRVYKELGYQTILLIPIQLNDQTIGLIELASHLEKPFDQALCETMATIAGLISQYVKRIEVEASLAEKNAALERSLRLAQSATQLKNEFMAKMSHEIRTPLNGIIGMTDIMLMDNNHPDHADQLNIVKSSAHCLLDIINDILDFSKIEAGKLSVYNKEFDLDYMLKELYATLSLQSNKKRISLTFEKDPDVPNHVIGDITRLKQILNNLISNAIKFTNQGSVSVSVKCLSRNAHTMSLIFSVIDTGIGVPYDKQENIFDPFNQVDNTNTRAFGGSGLGLSISHHLAKVMGGFIQLTSTPGVGSQFDVIIPVQLNSSTSEEANAIEVSSVLFDNSKYSMGNVLLVEDNLVNQKVTSKLLERHGYRIQIANNGQEAVELYENNQYDLVLMDIQMPVMDGLEATRLIRLSEQDKDSLTPQGNPRYTPIVALTAHALKGDRERFLAAGMDDYLSKPVEAEKLLDTVQLFIHNSTPEIQIPSLNSDQRAHQRHSKLANIKLE